MTLNFELSLKGREKCKKKKEYSKYYHCKLATELDHYQLLTENG